eukprot:GHVP01013577.1.p1 GENE.GHVP01013577.1~~GHVP01013577.1.p1  ORF type:complete len:627 (-),score=141.20 GHVP01013577.1:430-2310(-)
MNGGNILRCFLSVLKGVLQEEENGLDYFVAKILEDPNIIKSAIMNANQSCQKRKLTQDLQKKQNRLLGENRLLEQFNATGNLELACDSNRCLTDPLEGLEEFDTNLKSPGIASQVEKTKYLEQEVNFSKIISPKLFDKTWSTNPFSKRVNNSHESPPEKKIRKKIKADIVHKTDVSKETFSLDLTPLSFFCSPGENWDFLSETSKTEFSGGCSCGEKPFLLEDVRNLVSEEVRKAVEKIKSQNLMNSELEKLEKVVGYVEEFRNNIGKNFVDFCDNASEKDFGETPGEIRGNVENEENRNIDVSLKLTHDEVYDENQIIQEHVGDDNRIPVFDNSPKLIEKQVKNSNDKKLKEEKQHDKYEMQDNNIMYDANKDLGKIIKNENNKENDKIINEENNSFIDHCKNFLGIKGFLEMTGVMPSQDCSFGDLSQIQSQEQKPKRLEETTKAESLVLEVPNYIPNQVKLSFDSQDDDGHIEKLKNQTIKKSVLKEIRIVAQFQCKFLIAVHPVSQKLLIIDQHAAGERIQLEKLMGDLWSKDSSNKAMKIQFLPNPQKINLNAVELSLATKWQSKVFIYNNFFTYDAFYVNFDASYIRLFPYNYFFDATFGFTVDLINLFIVDFFPLSFFR